MNLHSLWQAPKAMESETAVAAVANLFCSSIQQRLKRQQCNLQPRSQGLSGAGEKETLSFSPAPERPWERGFAI